MKTLQGYNRKKWLNCQGNLLEISKPLVMGILNTTPDSFYDGGRYPTLKAIEARIETIIREKADIIDVGAFSSRPGAEMISEDEEWKRIYPVLQLIRKKFPNSVISIDTFRAGIAEKSVKEFKVDIINDISAGSLDAAMFPTVADLGVPYILMHMQGTPRNMQSNPVYEDVTRDIIKYFSEKIRILRDLGVKDIILDPGFGFGKKLEHNYELLKNLSEFQMFELPILAGLSRKSMIYKYLEISPDEALTGTIALNMIALLKGANILRVHDVKEAKETVALYNLYKNEK